MCWYCANYTSHSIGHSYLLHYPMCACAAGVKQCLSCLCVHLSAKIASSRLAKAFTDVTLNANKIKHSVPDASPGSSFRCYFRYFLLSVSWLHPVQITRSIIDRTSTGNALRRNTLVVFVMVWSMGIGLCTCISSEHGWLNKVVKR